MKNDGGPAFPQSDLHGPYASGMSLRDWLAGQALAGMLANSYAAERLGGNTTGEQICADAYGWADTMLKAREKPTAANGPRSLLLSARKR